LRLLSVVASLAAAFVVSGALIQLAGGNFLEAFANLFQGAFGSRHAILETLVKAIPLILTGLATAIAFKGKIWTIGQEGQLYAGAIMGYWAYDLLQDLLPRFPLVLAIVMAGFLGGAIYGWIPGILKAYFDVDEVISTVMGNYIVVYLLSLLLSGVGPWREPGSFYQQSAIIAERAYYPLLVSRSRLHSGLFISLLMAVVIYIIMRRSPLGFEIRAFGSNPNAVKFKGTNIARLLIFTMVISGGLCGLAGVGELFGVQHRLRLDLSPGYGYTGIIVAMLADLNPLGVIPAAVLFGGLLHGSVRMQVITGIHQAVVQAIQAIVLLFFLSSQVLTRYRILREGKGD
jgi:simple sugar transport system permease protein